MTNRLGTPRFWSLRFRTARPNWPCREELIHVLARAAEQRDHETGNHVLRVGTIAAIIAAQLGLSETRAHLIGQAAILHDVGKIGISDTILLKPGKLEAEEIGIMKKHCEYGMNILHGASTAR